MSQIDKRERVDNAGTVLHWYDFIALSVTSGRSKTQSSLKLQHYDF